MAECDFAPAFCEAHAIASCIEERACALAEFGLPGVSFGLDKALDGLVNVQVKLNEQNICFILALTQAFLKAGCAMPALPPPPELPDFSECRQEVADMVAEAEDPIGKLSSIYQVTLDENNYPTRIKV